MAATFKNEILSIIFRYGAVTRESLFLLRDDRRYTERIIKQCLQDGYIEEYINKNAVTVDNFAPVSKIKYRRIIDGNSDKPKSLSKDKHHYFRTLKYYTLTDRGIEYLVEIGHYAPDEVPTAKALRNKLRYGGRTVHKLLETSQSELLLWSISKSDSKVYSYNKDQLILQVGYSFANSGTVKHVAITESKATDEVSLSDDYKRGRFSGCYFSEKSAVAVYNNLSPGFYWSKQTADTDKRAIELFVDAVKRENKISGVLDISSCVLVNNPKHLKQIFFDLPGARRIPAESSCKSHVIGDPFSAMYAIPVNMVGAYHLYSILNREIENAEEKLLNHYLEMGFKSDMKDSVMVRMNAGNQNTSFLVSLSLNLNHMYLIQKRLNGFSDEKCGVICLDWQIPYWKALFGPDLTTVEAPKLED